MTVLVGQCSEEEIIASFAADLPFGRQTLVGSGDDCAVVRVSDSRFVVSTDVLVQDRHFKCEWSSGYQVGARAAAQNLADVAAMGARPIALVCSLVLPPKLPLSWVQDFARALGDRCGPLGCGVVGGDLSGGESIVAAITVHGDLAGGCPVLRAGAKPGDTVAVAGTLGWSALGLALLKRYKKPNLVPKIGSKFVENFLAPNPPLNAGIAANLGGASAMMDVSDGLVRDAGRIARASGVQILLNSSLLESFKESIIPGTELLDEEGPEMAEYILAGGEDHSMLATFPPEKLLPPGFKPIGEVIGVPEGRQAVVLVDGAEVVHCGWSHFS